MGARQRTSCQRPAYNAHSPRDRRIPYTVTVSMPRGAPVQGTPRDLQVAHGRLGLGGLQDDVTRFS
jgi:hypothetical protein